VIRLTYNGRTQTLAQWSNEIGLTPQCIHHRIMRGVPIEEALTKPIQIVKGARIIDNKTLRCAKCDIIKDVNEFVKHRKMQLGRDPYCKICRKLLKQNITKKRQQYWNVHDSYEEHKTGIRHCRKCKKNLSVYEFSRNNARADGLSWWCKLCTASQSQYNKYGKNVLVTDVCEICGSATKLGIDHNHKTFQIRGVLCALCNTALGMFEDKIIILQSAIKYLKKYNNNNE